MLSRAPPPCGGAPGIRFTCIDTDLQIDAYTPEVLENLASALLTHHRGLHTTTDHHLSDLCDLIEVQRSGNLATQMATRKETANRHLSDSAHFPRSEMVGDTGVEPVTSCVSCKRANQLRQSP